MLSTNVSRERIYDSVGCSHQTLSSRQNFSVFWFGLFWGRTWLLVLSTDIYLVDLLRITDAEENLGESEVREAHLAKSLFYIRIGDKVGNNEINLIFLPALFVSVMWTYSTLYSLLMSPGEGIGTTQVNWG